MTGERFENRLNRNKIKFNTINPVWDNEKQDALNVFEMIDMLNHLHEENGQLQKQLRNSIELIRKDTGTIFELEEKIKELKGFIEEYL